MKLTISAIWIPVLLTLFCLGMMFRPGDDGAFGMGTFLRIFWIIPILLIWIAYLLFALHSVRS